jgi:hypothetical protein
MHYMKYTKHTQLVAHTQRAGGPHQLIEDRAFNDPQDGIQNVSAVMRGGSIFGEGEAFAIRGFRQQ